MVGGSESEGGIRFLRPSEPGTDRKATDFVKTSRERVLVTKRYVNVYCRSIVL